MNRGIIIKLALILLIGAVAGIGALWGIRHQKQSADPEAAAEQVKNMQHPLPNVEIIDAAWVDGRIVVQAQFLGSDAETPRALAEWHQVAQSCARWIHMELREKHAVEVQLFHNDEFRAVSVAGL